MCLTSPRTRRSRPDDHLHADEKYTVGGQKRNSIVNRVLNRHKVYRLLDGTPYIYKPSRTSRLWLKKSFSKNPAKHLQFQIKCVPLHRFRKET